MFKTTFTALSRKFSQSINQFSFILLWNVTAALNLQVYKWLNLERLDLGDPGLHWIWSYFMPFEIYRPRPNDSADDSNDSAADKGQRQNHWERGWTLNARMTNGIEEAD